QSMHSDRFVMLARVRSHAGEERAYALKVYADDFSRQVWAHSQAVAERCQTDHGALCLPIRHIPHERTLVFPWVEGVFLSEIVDDRKTQLLRQAAGVAADLHRLDIVPEARTTPEMLVEESRARCDQLRDRWPETAPLVEPLMDRLEEAVTRLDPADPAANDRFAARRARERSARGAPCGLANGRDSVSCSWRTCVGSRGACSWPPPAPWAPPRRSWRSRGR